MKWIKFSKYTGDDFGIDANDLMQALSDFFLQSGFNDPYMQFQEWNQQTLEDLKRAIQEALESGRLFPDDQMQQMLEKLASMSPEQMDQLLENFVQKLAEEGHISTEQETEDTPGKGGGQFVEPAHGFLRRGVSSLGDPGGIQQGKVTVGDPGTFAAQGYRDRRVVVLTVFDGVVVRVFGCTGEGCRDSGSRTEKQTLYRSDAFRHETFRLACGESGL